MVVCHTAIMVEPRVHPKPYKLFQTIFGTKDHEKKKLKCVVIPCYNHETKERRTSITQECITQRQTMSDEERISKHSPSWYYKSNS